MSTNKDIRKSNSAALGPPVVPGRRPRENRGKHPPVLRARHHRHSEDYTYETGKAETWRHMLYCDPERLEYYDDGSLRITDPDMVDAIRRWSKTAEGKAILAGQVAKGPALDINGRGC